MPTFKNIKIKKRGGGTRMQRVKVLSSGKFKFVKNIGSTKTKSPRTRKAKTRRKGVKRMARRRRNRRRSSNSITIPVAVVVPMVLPAVRGVQMMMAGDVELGVRALAFDYLGIETDEFGITGQNFAKLGQTIGGIAVGALVHKFVGGSPLNVNKLLAKAKVPFLRL